VTPHHERFSDVAVGEPGLLETTEIKSIGDADTDLFDTNIKASLHLARDGDKRDRTMLRRRLSSCGIDPPVTFCFSF